jgi:hypothetical protein
MSNYALDTPFNKKLYVPGENGKAFSTVTQPKHTTEVDQTHRNLNWLFHKPQNHSFFPIQPESARLDKKK